MSDVFVPNKDYLVEVNNLKQYFPIKAGMGKTIPLKAVDGVSFAIKPGETLGLVGESGCGKTTVGRSLLHLYKPTSGDIFYNGQRVDEKSIQSMRKDMQMVFQDPYSSLNPRMTVEDIIGEPLDVHKLYTSKGERRDKILHLMELVGLNAEHATRYAHEFSGGQRQRIGIARALATNPKFIICDEAVSALDVSIQAQVINMFEELQDKLGIAYLFIAHDLLVVHHISDRIAVMYLGRVVEIADADELNASPIHPYTCLLYTSFPEKVAKQAERIKETLNEGDFYGREDLRDVVMVTIDGEDAKDLDDAVSLTKDEEFYHLGVHIADVSNYVQYNSALDKEALKRGTSVYLADRVIPMLPKKLSNGICSLNAGEDRLALSCLMDIDKKGRVVSHRIVESVIHVKERMSYTDVKKILLQEDEELAKCYEELLPMFFQMKELSELLRNRRKKRGAIDFDFPESKLVLDERGKVIDIYPYEQNIATRLIEDFMLAANETVAEEYCMLGLPFVYRTHENPDMEKMETVLEMVHQAGIKVKKGKETITPKEVQKILKELEGMECEPFFARLILPSMKQAKYNVEDTGHFGLAAKYYCHFTSPIRRYPDLQIHRIIKETLRGKMTEAKIQHYRGILEEVARQSSACLLYTSSLFICRTVKM